MELHSLLGQHPGSPEVDALLVETAAALHKKNNNNTTTGATSAVPRPTVKIYKDAVYYSYPAFGISFNYEPSQPLIPSVYTNSTPDPSVLRLVAIHLYRSPADKYETFPLTFVIPKKPTTSNSTTEPRELVKMDMEKKGHEVVQLLGEPEEKQGGGRKGNCWVGYGRTTGVSMDFAGGSWEDREMGLACLTIALPTSI
ncbi:hypothetical protein K457DRAFT_132903 [Linnemannia elongata AG-77]|uniref:Uncharacterized protein n=1 Tax=Linnemannia elongata AG-77 TaxID=1314771 RepID=A0A197KBY9_9FUNG|nr:hypothetical protein K457DRAFT_132903 [Linnemannia elongata AG-77]